MFAERIPVMIDRAQQDLHFFALDPVLETNADRDSYGFRQKRSHGVRAVVMNAVQPPWSLDYGGSLLSILRSKVCCACGG